MYKTPDPGSTPVQGSGGKRIQLVWRRQVEEQRKQGNASSPNSSALLIKDVIKKEVYLFDPFFFSEDRDLISGLEFNGQGLF